MNYISQECYWGLNLPGEGNLRAVAKILSYLLKQIKEFNTDNKIKKNIFILDYLEELKVVAKFQTNRQIISQET